MQADIFETLKVVLRARRLTYAALAERLGLSEPTVKRIFAERDCKLSRIVEICDVLGLTLDDVTAQTARAEVKPIGLGDRVEARLALDPQAFHLFLLLRDGMSMDAISAHYDLHPDTLFRIGLRLEAIGLAQVMPKGRIKLLPEQPVRFRRDGPLHRTLMRLNVEFVRDVFNAEDSDEFGFLTQSRRISKTTARHVMERFKELHREISELARRDQLTFSEADLQSYKLALAWSPVSFSKLLKLE